MTIHCLIFEYHKFQSVFKCCLLNLRSQFGWNQTGRWILDRSESTFNARWHFCWSWMESYLYGIVARSSGSSSNGTMHALVRIIDLDVLFVRADTDPKLSRAWRVLAGSSVWGPLVLYIKPNGGQIYLYRDGGRIQNCLLEVYWTNSCWFRVGLRICLAPRHPSVWRVRLSALVVNSALFMMCVINLANIRYGWPGTSR